MDKTEWLGFIVGGITLIGLTGVALHMVLRHQIHRQLARRDADLEEVFRDQEQAVMNQVFRTMQANGMKPVRGVYNRQTGEFVHLTIVEENKSSDHGS